MNKSQPDSLNPEQLKKYADDIAKIYKSEKQKRKELEVSNLQLQKYASDLSESVKQIKLVNEELHDAYLDTINRLVIAAEYKDEDTADHIVRMSRYSALIAEKMDLPEREVQNLLYSAPMHDIGKIGIPDRILVKPAKLTREEFELMKTHPKIGAKILANSKSVVLQMAQQVAVSHHEKWNGRGYPQGLSGEKIPLMGRIVALADCFDALTSRRPYKQPYPLKVALEIIEKEKSEAFDPEVTDIFLSNIADIMKIRLEVDKDFQEENSNFEWSERDL